MTNPMRCRAVAALLVISASVSIPAAVIAHDNGIEPVAATLSNLAPKIALPATTPAAQNAEPQLGPVTKGTENQDEAARFRLARQVDEQGEIPADALMRAKAQVDLMRQRARLSPAVAGINNSVWSWLGPTNIAGRIRTIAIHPSNPAIIFVGSVGGGIWKTTNSGANWTAINDFMANLSVSTIVFQPGTPSTIYAGTGEGFYNFGRVRGAGIFKSTDSGATWTQLASTATADFHFVNRLAVSANGATILAGTSVGVFSTTDAGASWTKVLTPAMAVADILDVKFLSGSSTTAVASGFSRNAYYSTNGGATWTVAGGLTPAGNFTRVEIGVSVSSPGVVYLSVDAGSSAAGEVWRSTDGGVSYAITAAKPNHLGAQGFYSNAVWVDPSNANRVVVGGAVLAATTDGGASWTTRSPGVGIPVDQHAIVSVPGFDGTSNTRVYIGNDNGVYTTADITASPFTSVAFTALNNGLGVTQFYGVAGNATSGKIIGGTQDTGTLIYAPATGTTWTIPASGDGGMAAADPVDPNYLYGEYPYLGIHRNTQGGAAASSSIYGYSDTLGRCKDAPYSITDSCTRAANFIAPFVLDPNDPNRLLAGGFSLWRTNDVKAPLTTTAGPTWMAIKAPDGGAGYISAIAVSPVNPDVIWVGHNSTGAVYKTTNGTAASPTWVNMRTSVLPTRYVARIAVDRADANVVYVAFAGFSTPNLWRTIDGGTTWAPASGTGPTALPAAPIYSVVVHPTTAGWVYVGTEIGVFASTDGGATWSLPHDGPANVSVEELTFVGASLVAATHGRGVFSTAACSYTLSAASGTVSNAGGGGTVTVTPSAGTCSWTATSDSPAWLTVTGSGTGTGRLAYTAAANSSAPRTGTITAGGVLFVVSQGATSTVAVDRASLAFGAINSNGTLSPVTSRQTVTVTFDSSRSWTASTTTPWLQVGNASGSGNGQFTVSVVSAPGLPATGTLPGSVTITAPGVTNSPQTVTVSLTLFASTASSAPAFGAFDTPAAGAGVEGSIAVTGWALDDIEVDRVEIWRDKVAGETTPAYGGGGPGNGKVFIANTLFINGARPDVEAAFPSSPYAYRAGWGYLLLTWGLWDQGNGPFTLYAFAYDREGRATILGSKTITVSNATATKPFGGIDTPSYGQTMTESFYNFGWALTPNRTPSCTIGAAGVRMAIDSGPLVPVAFGDTRPDIVSGFPSFTNTNNAGGAFYLDTSTLTNGTHQIGWYVVDDCGRADGIGSRFFTVLNGSATRPAPDAVRVAARTIASVAGEPVEVRRGLETTLVHPGVWGDRLVSIEQNERVEVHLPTAGTPYAGFQVVTGTRRALPLGSSLDAAQGIFYWQPAAGFLGPHDLEFVSAGGAIVGVRSIVATSVQAVIDAPSPGPVGSSFLVAGWALDEAAASGSGVDTVHVWAYPATGGAPIFLGVAAYGDVRPDVGALFGDQFARASYNLWVGGLAPGIYDVVVYPHSAVVGDFHGARVVRVTVR